MRHVFWCVSLCLLGSGCRVGPDYEPPVSKVALEFSEDVPEKTFVPQDEDLVQWWKRFDDPFLNSLLEEAVAGNFDYKIALEQVIQARATYDVQFAAILPEIDFDMQGSRFRTSKAFTSAAPPTNTTTTTATKTGFAAPNTSPSTTTTTTSTSTTAAAVSPIQDFFQIGFDCVWELDLFGKLRRTATAAYDTWEGAVETSRDVKITVLSEVANTYSLVCAAQEQLAVATQIVNADNELLSLSYDRFTSGLTNEQEVESARSALEVDKATLQSYQTQLKSSIYSLAVLLGREPEQFVDQFLEKRPLPQAHGKVPAGVPADLLKRRHDIRAAERQLAAATEQVGVAVAQLYPSISLTGSSSSFAANPLQGANVGWSSDKFHKLFKKSARIWGYGALLTMPIFDFGKRLAGIDAQVAAQHIACLNYEKIVISALQEVETSLATYFDEEEREKSYATSAAADKKNYELTLALFKAGLVDFSQVNQLKEVWLKDLLTLTSSKQALMSDLIAVYKSLGGEW
ncbi:MAG: efflux transporter outer membrane subunit [Verrucomicrobia bacterium]|nr:efflux transporter outer membrane subunit [Verrucomicrobiota bacterium]